MKPFWLRVLFESLYRIVGGTAWNAIKEQVAAAEFCVGLDGEAKKKLVMERLRWLIADLKKGTSSEVLRQIMHILVAIAVDVVVAKAKVEIEK